MAPAVSEAPFESLCKWLFHKDCVCVRVHVYMLTYANWEGRKIQEMGKTVSLFLRSLLGNKTISDDLVTPILKTDTSPGPDPGRRGGTSLAGDEQLRLWGQRIVASFSTLRLPSVGP